MSELAPEEDVYALQAKITLQQSHIRALKKLETPAPVVTEEVAKLTELRAKLAAMTAASGEQEEQFNKRGFDELILRKMYVVPAFEIHNGPGGEYSMGKKNDQ